MILEHCFHDLCLNNTGMARSKFYLENIFDFIISKQGLPRSLLHLLICSTDEKNKKEKNSAM